MSVVVVDASQGWTLVRPGPLDRFRVRWSAPNLDAQLAAGAAPEGERGRAVRASLLVDPAARSELADCWQAVLDRSMADSRWTDPRMPLLRARLAAANTEIRQLIGALRASAPVSARGVAIARQLLTDGAGPLYNARSALDLGATVRAAVRHLAE
jgi:hypothetical protein